MQIGIKVNFLIFRFCFYFFVFVFCFLFFVFFFFFLNLTLYVNWGCNWKWPISDLLVLECWVSGEFEKLTKWKYIRVLSTKVPLCWFVMAYVKVSHLSDIDILPLRLCKSTRYEKEDAYIGYIKDNYRNMQEWRIRWTVNFWWIIGLNNWIGKLSTPGMTFIFCKLHT